MPVVVLNLTLYQDRSSPKLKAHLSYTESIEECRGKLRYWNIIIVDTTTLSA